LFEAMWQRYRDGETPALIGETTDWHGWSFRPHGETTPSECERA
jgi:hypothetical protein